MGTAFVFGLRSVGNSTVLTLAPAESHPRLPYKEATSTHSGGGDANRPDGFSQTLMTTLDFISLLSA